jgi:hypothetical protein
MTNSQIQLHQQALHVLHLIEENNEQIAKMYDKCVEIEKCPNTSPSFKKMFIEQFHDMIRSTRAIKVNNAATYAEIMAKLVKPAMDRMEYLQNQ